MPDGHVTPQSGAEASSVFVVLHMYEEGGGKPICAFGDDQAARDWVDERKPQYAAGAIWVVEVPLCSGPDCAHE
jgi:hypothetical protein